MALIDTTSLIIGSALTANSLPNPTTVNGRTHILVNNGTSACTWTSSGPANPFTVDGAVAASLTVPAGRFRQLASDGSTWSVAPSASRRVFAGSGVSDASGNVVFTFTPPFTAAPKVSQAIETTNTNATEARVTALSASSCTINVRQSPGVVVLGISVLQVPQPLVGATVHLHAIEAGQGV